MAEICYTQLNLLLLAIEARKYEGGEIYINPKDKIINPNAIGEFAKQTDPKSFILMQVTYIILVLRWVVYYYSTYSANSRFEKFTFPFLYSRVLSECRRRCRLKEFQWCRRSRKRTVTRLGG